MGALRPHPGTRVRPVFNWLHWLLGNTALTFGIMSIFVASSLSAANFLPVDGFAAIVFGWFVAFALVHIALYIQRWLAVSEREKRAVHSADSVGKFSIGNKVRR